MTGYGVGLVAAMELEVRPLVRKWRRAIREYEGRSFQFYESGGAVLVCGGIGPAAARRAAEALINLYSPASLISVGFAGALQVEVKAGTLVRPLRVIDARDGSSSAAGGPDGVLVSSASVAGVEQKRKLAGAYGGRAVDMEAASVARVADLHGMPFEAIKVISDEMNFEVPGGDQFVDMAGKFKTGKFALYVAIRPWLWVQVMRLAHNSTMAANALSMELKASIGLLHGKQEAQPGTELYPVTTSGN